LAFVTSATRDAGSPDIADYNTFVTLVANSQTELSALGTNWRAIASTINDNAARINTGTNPDSSTGVPIYRLDDTRIADNNADLWDGTLQAPLNTTETMTSANYVVWTGTGDNGLSLGQPLGGAYPTEGAAGASDSEWVNAAIGHYTIVNRFYAISDPLTVPTTVPIPAAVYLFGTGIAGLLAAGWRRRAGSSSMAARQG
jgi:hypothetical protein